MDRGSVAKRDESSSNCRKGIAHLPNDVLEVFLSRKGANIEWLKMKCEVDDDPEVGRGARRDRLTVARRNTWTQWC